MYTPRLKISKLNIIFAAATRWAQSWMLQVGSPARQELEPVMLVVGSGSWLGSKTLGQKAKICGEATSRYVYIYKYLKLYEYELYV